VQMREATRQLQCLERPGEVQWPGFRSKSAR
jgi:hypothetical protein